MTDIAYHLTSELVDLRKRPYTPQVRGNLHRRMSAPIQSRREILLFVLVGGIAAAANFGSRFVFSVFARFDVAVVLAFFVGLATAFVLNRAFVFVGERSTSWRIEALRFVVVNLGGLVLTLVVSLYFLHYLLPATDISRGPEAIAHLAGIAATVVSSYLAHKFWTFRG